MVLNNKEVVEVKIPAEGIVVSTAIVPCIEVSCKPTAAAKRICYPTPFGVQPTRVRFFYCRYTKCEVFYACDEATHQAIEENSWADVSDEFTAYVEGILMPFCVEHTNWSSCFRYGVDYSKMAQERDEKGRFTSRRDSGCDGAECHCEPFGSGDWTNMEASRTEYQWFMRETGITIPIPDDVEDE